MKVLKPLHFDQTGRISVSINHRIFFIEMSLIQYCTADGNYTDIHHIDGTTFIISDNLGDVLKKLEQFGFFAIDKSCVINLMYIRGMTQERNAKVMLDDSVELKVARDRKSELMNILFDLWCVLIAGDLLYLSFL